MSSLSDVRTAWQEVLDNATVQGYTTNQYNYDIVNTTNESINNTSLFYIDGQLNFIQYVFTKDTNFGMIQEKTETFNVIINYYREIDIDGDNYHAVTDFFDELFEVVRSEIGYFWNDKTDFYTVGSVSVGADELDGRACWNGSLEYTGTKNIALT